DRTARGDAAWSGRSGPGSAGGVLAENRIDQAEIGAARRKALCQLEESARRAKVEPFVQIGPPCQAGTDEVPRQPVQRRPLVGRHAARALVVALEERAQLRILQLRPGRRGQQAMAAQQLYDLAHPREPTRQRGP